MNQVRSVVLLSAALFAAFAACKTAEIDSGDDSVLDAGSDTNPDGSVADPNADAGYVSDGGAPVQTPDGGTCYTAACAGKVYACGDCLDNDGDGKIDSTDPDCLGPCHNRENNFDLGIPGGGHGNCGSIECYYDSNSGRGNDDCVYDLRCDPKAPDPACAYSSTIAGDTSACPTAQSATCTDVCGSLTPNGCDCFGCCNVPLAGGGSRNIFLGSQGITGKECTLASAGDPAACRECTPNPSCIKGCGTCQLCLGKTTLPPQCLGVQQCPTGKQACGLEGQANCPAGMFCLTGCCIAVIN